MCTASFTLQTMFAIMAALTILVPFLSKIVYNKLKENSASQELCCNSCTVGWSKKSMPRKSQWCSVSNEHSFAGAHNKKVLPPGCKAPEYSTLRTSNFNLSCSSPDNCCIINGHIILTKNFACDENTSSPVVIGCEFLKQENPYVQPLESSRLGIVVVSKLSELRYWPINNIKKAVLLPFWMQVSCSSFATFVTLTSLFIDPVVL